MSHEDAEVLAHRSSIDPKSWVAVPHGMPVDQTFALHSGRLTRVMTWAANEYAFGRVVDWIRVDRDTYRMRVHDEG